MCVYLDTAVFRSRGVGAGEEDTLMVGLPPPIIWLGERKEDEGHNGKGTAGTG